MEDFVDDLKNQLIKIAKDKKNQGAALGAAIGYLISNEETRNRNAIIGGLVGYLISHKKEE